MSPPPTVLFTAFEPSGDALAASLIKALRRSRPEVQVAGFGGPRMKQAGAQLLGKTTEHAVMLLGAAMQANTHYQRLRKLSVWLKHNRITALVPVDSPAANWSVCRLIRRRQRQAKIVHLVAPQVWAWGGWRIHKLRRLTDQLLCLLPFEPQWFERRDVPATFVGHPLFDPPPSDPPEPTRLEGLPANAAPALALLPGSRPKELRANWPTMLQTFDRLRAQHSKLQAVVAAASRDAGELILRMTPRGKMPIKIVWGRTGDILSWADVALVVSGTATLEAAAHGTPQVAMYNARRWGWPIARQMLQIRCFTLPNLIGQSLGLGQVIPELIPHFGAVPPVERALDRLIRNPHASQRQKESFARIKQCFLEKRFTEEATRVLLEKIEEGT